MKYNTENAEENISAKICATNQRHQRAKKPESFIKNA
jgi:hypothetical protein